MPTKKVFYGLLGYPIRHSLSPALHNSALRALRINAEYRLFEIAPPDLEDFILSLKKRNILGLNVTIPYKEKVLDFIKLEKDSLVAKIGATNTLVLRGGVLKAFNTDVDGFLRDLRQKRINPKKKKISILGAGGAAKAVVYALASLGSRYINVYDIDKKKAQALVELFRGLFPDCKIEGVEKIEDLRIKEKDILVNATPLGLKGEESLVKEEMLKRRMVVYDLIYNPPETKLLALAKRKGALAFNGLGMLLYQGALSFHCFTNKTPPLKLMRKALLEALSKC